MQTKEYLSIFALVFLGLCLISGLYKKAYAKSAKDNNIVCGISVYIAVVLIGVSQLLEEEKDTFVGSSLQSDCCVACMSKSHIPPCKSDYLAPCTFDCCGDCCNQNSDCKHGQICDDKGWCKDL